MTIESMLRDLLRARGARLDDLTHATTLGGDGLGLDSIAIAELLLECETRFGVNAAGLLEGQPITFGALLEHLRES